jgi:phosphatidylserine decarboxylase
MRMKNAGKARSSAFRMILWTLVLMMVMFAAAFVATVAGGLILFFSWVVVGLWVLFAVFCLYFFRDPTPQVPGGSGLVVAPGHGKVDLIDVTEEPRFMGGACQRVSIFLSVFDVHVQNAPVAGRVAFYKYTEGKFVNALKADSATHNENALIGFESSDPAGVKVGVRLIAGLIARRIVPWVALGDTVARGDRIGLIQFGSRVDLYLPREARVRVMVGQKVVGGQTVIAAFD